MGKGKKRDRSPPGRLRAVAVNFPEAPCAFNNDEYVMYLLLL